MADGGNDHRYEDIAGPVTWQRARAAALASTAIGVPLPTTAMLLVPALLLTLRRRPSRR